MNLTATLLLAFYLSFGSIGIINTDYQAINTGNDDKPELFYSKKGKFKIWFPCDKPELEKSKVHTDIGDIKLYTYKCIDNLSVFMIGYSDYPEKYMSVSNDEDLLDGAKGGFIKQMDLQVTEEDWFNISKYKGKYFKAHNSEYYASVRHVIVKNRLYQFVVVTKGSDEPNEKINKFFTSLILM